MVYAHDADIASKSAEGLAEMMTAVVTVFEVADLTVWEKKTEAMSMKIRDLASRAPPSIIEAAGQRYKQTMQCTYLDGVIHEDAGLMVEIKRRVRLMRACYKRLSTELFNKTTTRLSLKVPV